MRDIKRIETITNKIRKAWEKYPDFRFWQFISYMFEYVPKKLEGCDPFFWEEDVWEKMLDKMIKEK